jgi:hypothetical protein
MTLYFESVCTGNDHRSPIIEVITRRHLGNINASGYDACSSGTLVDIIGSGVLPVDIMTPIIVRASARDDVYGAGEIDIIRQGLRAGDVDTLTPYFNRAVAMFTSEENGFRERHLLNLGLNSQVKIGKDQTAVNPNAFAVFSADHANNRRVREMYAGKGYELVSGNCISAVLVNGDHEVRVAVLGAYATNDPSSEITSTFGMGEGNYKAIIRLISEWTPIAIDRALRESF